MIQLCLSLAFLITPDNMILFDFNNECSLTNWVVVDDGVMGGRSEGEFTINQAGHGLFSGEVSLDNYGGFSSIRYQFSTKNIKGNSKMLLRLKGDGKNYQFRVKSNSYDRQSYIYTFETTGDWQIIEIPLLEMKPSFRGRILDMENYQGEVLEEIAILIGNKKAERFKLEIDYIEISANKNINKEP